MVGPREQTVEQQVQLKMPGGTADAYIFSPDDSTSGVTYPGVIDMPDIRGIREATLDASRRLARAGYIVLAPNVFYRTGRPPVFDFPMNFAEERTQRRFAELVTPLTPEAMHADARAYVQALEAHGASPVKVGVLGHCFSGAQALRSAAAVPDRIGAAASFHGGYLFLPDDPSSPHLELLSVKAALYVAHAEADQLMPPEAIQHFNQALADWGGRYESEIYPASHGWTVTDSRTYNQEQAERATRKLLDLFAANLT